MRNVLVVGAGISGATVASLMADAPKTNVTVIDKSSVIAGNCYDYRDCNGIMIHKYGSHVMHTSDQEVWSFLARFTSFNTYMHRVVAVIEGIETTIPFNFDTIRAIFPPTLAERIETKLLSRFPYGSKMPIKDFMNQDDPDLKFLAEYIYENVFVHYTEKQWGPSSNAIDSAVTARVPVCLSRDGRYFHDRYQGIPTNGYTEMIWKMMEGSNIKLNLSTDFKEIHDLDRYDDVFFTGPIDELMGYAYGQLSYRSLRFELETHDCEHYQSNAVINYPNNYDFTRIHEYKYYLNDRSDKTVIAKEYPEDFKLGFNDRYYPVPTAENQNLYSEYLDKAKKRYPNMHFLGRLGDYKYYDMDKAVKRAMQVCQEASE